MFPTAILSSINFGQKYFGNYKPQGNIEGPFSAAGSQIRGFLFSVLNDLRHLEEGDKSEISELVRIHVVSCSARKQRAEEFQILRTRSKCPSPLHAVGLVSLHTHYAGYAGPHSARASELSLAGRLPQKASWPALLSSSTASFGSMHVFLGIRACPSLYTSLGSRRLC